MLQLYLLDMFQIHIGLADFCRSEAEARAKPTAGPERSGMVHIPPDILVQLISAELVQFSVSLSFFFVFCFTRAFYLILGT